MKTEVSQTVNERMAYWHSQGLHGAAVYDALSTDTTLPMYLEPEDVAAISGDSPLALKARRYRGQPPAFIRASGAAIRYPRYEYFQWLKVRFVPRTEQSAAPRYINQPAE
ncbi:hypothetical protein GOE05_23900 [Sinorhizobium medicae]|nr:hypothetical protein [Sinorhizobium medicae]